MIPQSIGVVIPCYNQGLYLPDAVMSVLAQSSPATELVIVDDGSTDATAEVLRELDRRIGHAVPVTAITHAENRGLSAARNTGIRHLKTEWVLPLDADDWLQPECLARLSMELTLSHGATVIAPRFQPGAWNPPAFNARLLPQQNLIPYCSLFSRAAWEAVGGYDEEAVSRWGISDWDFWLKLLEAGLLRVETVPLPLVYYREHPDSLSRVFRADFEGAFAALKANHPHLYGRAHVAA